MPSDHFRSERLHGAERMQLELEARDTFNITGSTTKPTLSMLATPSTSASTLRTEPSLKKSRSISNTTTASLSSPTRASSASDDTASISPNSVDVRFTSHRVIPDGVHIYTMDEVKRHSSPEDCWIVVDRKVYDVTHFSENHPGGPNVVQAMGGMDATQAFHVMHGTGRPLRKAQLMMKKYCIGTVSNDTFLNVTYHVKGMDSLNIQDHQVKKNQIDSDTESTSVESSSNEVLISLPQHDISTGDADFTQLREDIMADPNLAIPKWSDTMVHMLRPIPFLLMCLAILYHLKDMKLDEYTASTYWLVALAAFGLGMFWHQSAFVAHDACHRGTPEEHGTWHWFGCLYGSFMFGISTSMWGDEHYEHHVATRRPHGDPQFEYYPICLLSLKELDENHPINFFVRILLRIQHVFFLPVALLVGRINLHIVSIVYCIKHCLKFYVLPKKFGGRKRNQINRPEIDLIGMSFYFAYVFGMMSVLPWHYDFANNPYDLTGALPRILFFALANWVCGILHLQLLVSHIGVECFTQDEQSEQSWFSHQVLTSRNVTTTWWNGWFWGGLEFQIEHHLFPRLPRESLHKIAPRVKALCEQHNLPYRSDTHREVAEVVVNDFKAVATLALEIPA